MAHSFVNGLKIPDTHADLLNACYFVYLNTSKFNSWGTPIQEA